MAFVYLLKSQHSPKYYIGYTTDIEKRITAHNSGRVISTSKDRPWRIIGYVTFDNSNEARYYEHQLKQHSDRKRKFIANLLETHNSKGLRPGGPPAAKAAPDRRGA